jgi:two-component system sporulation sensor kinase B
MIIGFILTTIIALLFWLFDPKQASSRWAGFVFFTAGAGFLPGTIYKTYLPYSLAHPMELEGMIPILEFVAIAGSFSSVIIFPVCYLVFALHYSHKINSSFMNRMKLLLLLPIFLSLLIPALKHEVIVLIWVAPYMLFASYFLIQTYRVEQNLDRKRYKAICALFFVPITTIDLISGYALDLVEFEGAYIFNYVLVIAAFIVFMVLLIRFGMLGIRLRIERQQFDISREVFSIGSMKLFHALKNQIGNMNVQGHVIKNMASESANEHLDQRASKILNTASHMQAMMDRIELQSNNMIISPSPQPLIPLIDDVIHSFEWDQYNIHVTTEYPFHVILSCDPVHLRELMTNVISNAIDAIDPVKGGWLTIGFYSTKSDFVIYIKDNGHGIAKANLVKVMQPFYTTKNRANRNFGLGLTYCYNMMRKHGGSLELKSKEQIGTDVILRFKKANLVNIERNEKADVDEQNKGFIS